MKGMNVEHRLETVSQLMWMKVHELEMCHSGHEERLEQVLAQKGRLGVAVEHGVRPAVGSGQIRTMFRA